MVSPKTTAKHPAGKYLNITDPPLVSDNEDCKRRHHGNRNPCPDADCDAQSPYQQTGQHGVTQSPSTQDSKSPPGHHDHIHASSGSDSTERLPDNLTDNRTRIAQI